MRILIVDDSAFMRKLVRDTLTEGGFAVAGEAETGESAVEMFKKARPDLVTMDVVMLGKGGVQALKDLLQFDPEANVLMVSAMGQQDLIIEAIRAGAKGFVIKPFKPAELLAEVRRIFGEARKKDSHPGRGRLGLDAQEDQRHD